MSFLDSLENNLKALENREQTGLDDHKRRESERKQAIASGPWADQLKHSPYIQTLMQQASRASYQIRTKINMSWIGNLFRLEARNHRLELRPAADGIAAVYLKGGEEIERRMVDLSGQPDVLSGWIALVEAQKKLDDQAAAASLEIEEE